MPELLVTSPGYHTVTTNNTNGFITMTYVSDVSVTTSYYLLYDGVKTSITWNNFYCPPCDPLEYECVNEEIP